MMTLIGVAGLSFALGVFFMDIVAVSSWKKAAINWQRACEGWQSNAEKWKSLYKTVTENK